LFALKILYVIFGLSVFGFSTGCDLDGSSGSSPPASSSNPKNQTTEPAKDKESESPAPSSNSSSSSSGTILAIGDSITAGYGVSDPYVAKLSRMTKRKVANGGVNGENVSGGVSRIAGLMDRHKPTSVVILMGINDANREKSMAEAAANLGRIIDVAKAKGAKTIVIGTVPPLTGPKADRNDLVKDLNDRIRSLASSKGVRLADINKKMVSGTMSSDGIHPNNSGHAVIAAEFADKL